jgi:hypothetical protein
MHALPGPKDIACWQGDASGINDDRPAIAGEKPGHTDGNQHCAKQTENCRHEPGVKSNSDRRRKADKRDEAASKNARYVKVDARLEYHGQVTSNNDYAAFCGVILLWMALPLAF